MVAATKLEPEATVTAMARKRAPELLPLRPECRVEGLVFDAIVGLPNPPTVPVIAHWCGLGPVAVRKAIERMNRRGLLATAGRVSRYPTGCWQTYRVLAPTAVGSLEAV